MTFTLIALLALVATAPAHAKVQASALFNTNTADFTDYQIGDEWGKKPVTRAMMDNHSPAFTRAALATARVGGATGFYLGKFNGHHVMATNHHVMTGPGFCNAHRKVTFPILGKSFACEKFFGDWTGIDLALFAIEVTNKDDEDQLARIGRNFNFRVTLTPGQDLLTIGFGVFRNERRALVAVEDADCKVFSDKNDARFISDPDRINPADYKAWSFATGCDVSHGDSGSAMVDRNNGDVVGIIWTTATQKPERIRSSSHLDDVLKRQNQDDIWNWLSYAVPAPKMKEFLEDFLSKNQLPDEDAVRTITTVLNNSGAL